MNGNVVDEVFQKEGVCENTGIIDWNQAGPYNLQMHPGVQGCPYMSANANLENKQA